MMNLVQNILTLKEAVDDDQIQLKQALKFLAGLQKVYIRRMIYLHDDSNYVLSQMLEPLKPKTEIDQKQFIRDIKGEIVEEISTIKKKKKVD